MPTLFSAFTVISLLFLLEYQLQNSLLAHLLSPQHSLQLSHYQLFVHTPVSRHLFRYKHFVRSLDTLNEGIGSL